ncbi:MAG TPA: TlyA family RNA methyltransferase [Candidatus Saccharimonadales bacterium]|jgi:23S rRNA (cytidine1920-2'-O)/16S rRNA (cytidine1409-2'-O)-methyltransferase
MTKTRLDGELVTRGLVSTRSQAESWIRMGRVSVDGRVVTKAGFFVSPSQPVTLAAPERYVSRAGLKLASVAQKLHVEFNSKIVLDVGSSTGGFTDYALQHGAKLVYAVDVGTEQLHPSLRKDKRVKVYEKTDIRTVVVRTAGQKSDRTVTQLEGRPDIIVIDVSFISLREILPHLASIAGPRTDVVAMLKPQFEAGRDQVNRGVIKNDAVRRKIVHDFELWAKAYFLIISKADSEVAGSKGNLERFYLLRPLQT